MYGSYLTDEEDVLHDECGVVGVYLNGASGDTAEMNASSLAYYGM